MNAKFLFAAVLGTWLIFSGCKKKDDPVIPNEEELITTFTYTLIAQNTPDTVSLYFQDLDGDGGNAPIIIGGKLKANTVYSGNITLLNEQESPAEDLTVEINNEAEAHQFFFAPSSGLDVSMAYADADMNGNPIGLATTLSAQTVSSGTLTVTLRHKPDKFAAGVSSGDPTNAGGETDIEVVFDLDVE